MEKYGAAGEIKDDNIIWRMRCAWRITLIPLPQKWLRERATLLRLYVHCLFCYIKKECFEYI